MSLIYYRAQKWPLVSKVVNFRVLPLNPVKVIFYVSTVTNPLLPNNTTLKTDNFWSSIQQHIVYVFFPCTSLYFNGQYIIDTNCFSIMELCTNIY